MSFLQRLSGCHRWSLAILALFCSLTNPGLSQTSTPSANTPTIVVDPSAPAPVQRLQRKKLLDAQRKAAAARLAASRAVSKQPVGGKSAPLTASVYLAGSPVMVGPTGPIDYFGGVVPNYANSPLLRKFVHRLPGLGAANADELGNYIPIANPDTTTFADADYYQIGITDYTQQLHADLPAATKLRGYVDLNPAQGAPATDSNPHYLGPLIIARRDRPVRIKFVNMLGTGASGNLFLPVDTSSMGAGTGPLGGSELYTENRAELHLHGGVTPWISDGTPHQWITPAGDPTSYKKGASFQNVPDMGIVNPSPSDGDGVGTYYWTNQQSGRLMFYHDHSYGITRLNVYAGEAAGYLLTDPVEDGLIDGGVLPGAGAGVYRYGIPLIIQDKTFVPDLATLAAEDPTWDVPNWGGPGSLWFPHVYMTNQNPADISGANPMGRWDYGPWFWPPVAPGLLAHPPIPSVTPGLPDTPAFPNPTQVPESFMDTPLVNGAPYPTLTVEPKAYRFRILNAANDRMWNLSFFQADPSAPTEVKMVPAAPGLGLPANWPTDGRDGGVPDPTLQGPSIIQIGTEGGLLPTPVVIPPTPVGYNYNRRDIVVLNIASHSLLLGPAERADIVVDFSAYAGKTLILYNDGPAPVPAFDTRYDYYTGDPDQTSTGGAPPTAVGYGPNTRTIMQIQVANTTPAPAFDLAALNTAFAGPTSAFSASQGTPLVPQTTYNSALNTTLTDTFSRIQDTSLTYTPIGGTLPVTTPMQPKAIQELFELNYGRMNATLGVELPFTNFNTQTTIPLGYADPTTENLNDGQIQIWKITHNGVDTHPVHFHLFNVQLINRVGWDGAVRLPDPNEVGWKETVRMNPLEDAIVALQPIAPVLPFDVPNSVRSEDPTQPESATLTVTNPADGNPMTVSNAKQDMGWEYVWHCHILGHEENDFMRVMSVSVPKVTISGTVFNTDGTTPLSGATIDFTGGGSTTTGGDGTYTYTHSSHWTGSIAASLNGYTFAPPSIGFSDVVTDQPGQNFTAVAGPVVTGRITLNGLPLPGVAVTLNPGYGATTDANGIYIANVASGWTGTVTPSMANRVFVPVSPTLTNVTTAVTQNFTASTVVTVSGQVKVGSTGLPGVTLTFNPAVAGSPVVTDSNGNYTLTFASPYTGTVTPSLAGYVFSPVSRSYTAIMLDQVAQDYAATAVVVVSGQVAVGSTGLPGVTMTFSNGGGSMLTDSNGNYSKTFNSPWTGTVTPSKANYQFAPVSMTYTAITTDQLNQNYAATAVVTVSGQVTNSGAGGAGLPGVTLTFNPAVAGSPVTTDSNGNYTLTFPANYTGTVTPSLAGFIFTPTSRSYTGIVVDQTAQDYSATPVVLISGHVALGTGSLSGVTITFNPGGTVTTDGSGNYSKQLVSPWSGTITPSLPGYAFTPVSLSLNGVTTDQVNQNFTAFRGITVYGLVLLNGNPATPLSGVTMTFSNGGGAVVTDANGLYTRNVPRGWSGTLTPSLTGYAFTPVSRSFTNLTTNPAGQNFSARAVVIVSGQVIRGGVGLPGVTIRFSGQTAGQTAVTTDGSGNYTKTLNSGWTGTVTPSSPNRLFSPSSLSFTNLTTDQPNQNFVAVRSIAGRVTSRVGGRNVGVASVTITFSNGVDPNVTATTGAAGYYTALVPATWSGTATPALAGKTFTPATRSYTNVTTDYTNQNYAAQ
jgi:FtsP/CotA-like multicopper oxidase with cupredoxin domain